jgi:hypothetical protein
MTSRPNVTLRVVPFSCGNYPGCESAFTLLEYSRGEQLRDNVCLLDGFLGSLWVERAADRLQIARTFAYLEGIAYDIEQSHAFLETAKRHFT